MKCSLGSVQDRYNRRHFLSNVSQDDEWCYQGVEGRSTSRVAAKTFAIHHCDGPGYDSFKHGLPLGGFVSR